MTATTAAPPIAVIDIDGVVADVRHRLHYIEARPKRWEDFFTSAEHDPLLAEGAQRVHQLAADHEVVYLTGRPERTRELTQRWLEANGLPAGRLLMRPDEDRRSAKNHKREQLQTLAQRGRIAVMLDDDPSVIEMLKAEGWPAELAQWLPHSSTLRGAQGRDGRT